MLIRDTIGVDFDNYTNQTFTFENNMKYRSAFRCKMQICVVLQHASHYMSLSLERLTSFVS